MDRVFDDWRERLSVTEKVTGYVPSFVGVPDTTPVLASKLKPGGSGEPNDQIYGGFPPVALMVVVGYS